MTTPPVSIVLDPAATTRALFLPDLARVEDLAAMLGLTPSGARRLILRDCLGPFVRVGRRIVLRRESILGALRDREERPVPTALAPQRAVATWTRRIRTRSTEGSK